MILADWEFLPEYGHGLRLRVTETRAQISDRESTIMTHTLKFRTLAGLGIRTIEP
jgi:hypothetical protein